MITHIKNLIYKVEDFIINSITFLFKFKKKSKKRLHTIFLLCISFVFLGLGIFIIWFTTLSTPSLDSFDDKLLGQSAKIYDRTGTVLLYDLSQKVRRSVVPLENISPWIVKATISIEDKEFYTHSGIKITSLVRATLKNITSGGYTQGGSTITQQVVKNSFLSADKKIIRKVKEIFLALKLEKSMSKDDIMTLYLNNSPYGGNIYGVEEASQVFFGKHAKDVTLPEAAILASLPKAPSTYNPYFGKKDLLLSRKNLVLEEMYKSNLITLQEKKAAQEDTIIFQPKNLGSIKAAHFVMYLKEQLEEKFGAKRLSEGGFTIISTINYEIQKLGENIVAEYVAKNGKKFGAENASMVVTDPKTGQILAMIGSRDYFDQEIDGNYNIATAKRQPGSSFKPFVYATAFNKGFLPQTVLFDTPTEFSSDCTPSGTPKVTGAICYNPQNYEGGFKGPMSIRGAWSI
jgi:membrane peptidoglycan carboxypeptidase